MAVPILKHGDYLIASIQSALSDVEVLELRDDITERVGATRARGVIVDVAGMDVIDSFVARSLRRNRNRRYPPGCGGRDGAVRHEPRATPHCS
jgi:anti-anti-sigma regulatory factor